MLKKFLALSIFGSALSLGVVANGEQLIARCPCKDRPPVGQLIVRCPCKDRRPPAPQVIVRCPCQDKPKETSEKPERNTSRNIV